MENNIIMISGETKEIGEIIYINNNHMQVRIEDGYKYLTKLETSNSSYSDGKRCWKIKEL